MNHKRKRPKNRRSGCLLCKWHKGNGEKGKRRHQTVAGNATRRQEARANTSAREQGAL